LKTGQIEDIAKILNHTYKCHPEKCVYRDTYFDTISKDFFNSERELRLRKVIIDKAERILLTYKETPFDNASKSKCEYEIRVSSHEEASIILGNLGYTEDINFQKHCTNFQVKYRSLEILVTLVSMRELKQDFIEVEVQSDEADSINQIYEVLHEFLPLLEVASEQLTSEYYTDMVRNLRGK